MVMSNSYPAASVHSVLTTTPPLTPTLKGDSIGRAFEVRAEVGFLRSLNIRFVKRVIAQIKISLDKYYDVSTSLRSVVEPFKTPID